MNARSTRLKISTMALAFSLSACTTPTTVNQEPRFVWDLPVSEFSRYHEYHYLFELPVGKAAPLDMFVSFCTNDEGLLMIGGMSGIGEGNMLVRRADEQSVDIAADDVEELMEMLVMSNAHLSCDWQIAPGSKTIPREALYYVRHINGKRSVRELGESLKKAK
jgi:hypothetical protein